MGIVQRVPFSALVQRAILMEPPTLVYRCFDLKKNGTYVPADIVKISWAKLWVDYTIYPIFSDIETRIDRDGRCWLLLRSSQDVFELSPQCQNGYDEE